MKIVLLMYLIDDDEVVSGLLEDLEVTAFSRLGLEGHGEGLPGWHGEVTPYRSEMVFALLPDGRADELMEAVAGVDGVADPAHPVHAVKLAVEETAASGADRRRP